MIRFYQTLFLSIILILSSCSNSSPEDNNSSAGISAGENIQIDQQQLVLIELDIENLADDIVSIEWTQLSGIPINIEDKQSSTLSFITPQISQNETVVFQVTVTDNQNNQYTDEINVKILFTQPSAYVSLLDQTVDEQQSVNVSASINNLTVPISLIQWEQTSGFVIDIEDKQSLDLSFTTPDITENTTLTFKLTVTDTLNNQYINVVSIHVKSINTAPVILLNDQTVDETSTVVIVANINDNENNISQIKWLQTAGSEVVFNETDFNEITFIAPTLTVSETLKFTATVIDDFQLSTTASVDIIVNVLNTAPQINLIDELNVNEQSEVILKATVNDNDGSIVSTLWHQISGDQVMLNNSDSDTLSFTSPLLINKQTLVFELVVIDNEGAQTSASTSVSVLPINLAPNVHSGDNQIINEFDIAILEGKNSTDTDGAIKSYLWSQISGISVEIINQNSVQASFVAPDISDTQILVFELEVIDNENSVSTSQTTIVINPVTANPPVFTPTVNSLLVNHNHPTLTGSADDIASLTVTLAGFSYTDIPVIDGLWSLQIAAELNLQSQVYDVVVIATNASGVSVIDNTYNELEIDLINPSIPTINTQITNLITPILSGTADKKTLVNVEIDSVIYNNITVGPLGNWFLDLNTTPTAGLLLLTAQTYDVIVTSTDMAGNFSVDTTTNELEIDLTKPNAATMDSLTTNSVLPILSGQADLTATLTLTITDDVIYNNININADGSWILDLSQVVPNQGDLALTDGNYTVNLTAENQIGNQTLSTGLLTINQALVTPTIDSLIVVTTTPILSGYSDNNSYVSILIDSAVYSNVSTDTEGLWQLDLATAFADLTQPVLMAGNSYDVRVISEFGLFDESINEIQIVQDPIINSLVTLDINPELSGLVGLNLSLNILVDGNSYSAIVDEFGNWTTQITQPLSGGIYEVSAIASDTFGNIYVDYSQNELEINTNPTINILSTNNITPTLQGFADRDSQKITLNIANAIYEGVVNTDGSWLFDLSNLTPSSGELDLSVNGFYNVSVTSIDASDFSLSDISIDELYIDTQILNPSITFQTTNKTKPTISGTAEASSSIELLVNGQLYYTVTDAITGIWTLQASSTNLYDDTYEIEVTATDLVGNQASDTSYDELIIEAITPSITIDSLSKLESTASLNGAFNIIIEGDFAYVSLKQANQLNTYSVDTQSGSLTLIQTLSGLSGAAGLDYFNGFVYLTLEAANQVKIYKVESDGTLTIKQTKSDLDLVNAYFVKVENFYAYVTTGTAGFVIVYSVNVETGKLTYIETIKQYGSTRNTAVDNGFVYITNSAYDVIVAYSINNDGTLKKEFEIGGLNGPYDIKFNTINAIKYAYVAAQAGGHIKVYTVDEMDGSFTFIQTISGLNEIVELSIDGSYLYSISSPSSQKGRVSLFAINDHGIISLIDNHTESNLKWMTGMAINNGLLYVASRTSDSVTIFSPAKVDLVDNQFNPIVTNPNFGKSNDIAEIIIKMEISSVFTANLDLLFYDGAAHLNAINLAGSNQTITNVSVDMITGLTLSYDQTNTTLSITQAGNTFSAADAASIINQFSYWLNTGAQPGERTVSIVLVDDSGEVNNIQVLELMY
ncbi:MAG: beta-propeller fold lactonase family protein [Saccharospirillaceae bacterium]|nr:beta-propeller fold lactonase family protein [Saccharospirillaceae bacterium]